MTQARSEITKELANNPLKELVKELASLTIKIEWGWGLLIVGAICIIASAAIPAETNDETSENSFKTN